MPRDRDYLLFSLSLILFASIMVVLWFSTNDKLTTTQKELETTKNQLTLYKIDGETTYNHFKFSQKVSEAYTKGDMNAYEKWMPTFSLNYYGLIQQYDDDITQNLLTQFSECNKKANALTGNERIFELRKCDALNAEIDARLIQIIEPRYLNSYSYKQFQKEPIDANKVLDEVKN